jgi:Tol biopolymer transport system component
MIEGATMAARAGEATRVTGASSAVDRDVDLAGSASASFAWLTLFFAAWLVGAITAAVRAAVQGLGASLFQQAVDIFNLGVIALAVVCLAILVRAQRRGRPLRRAFPSGYGVLGAGLGVLLAWEVADRGWLQGVAELQGVEQTLAPPRILLFIGMVLVACGPLRAAISSRAAHVPRWAAVLSAAGVLTAIGFAGEFHPAQRPLLQHVPAAGAGEIWAMDGDGSHQTRLVESPSDVGGPWNVSWSPDGSRMAFSMVSVGPNSPVDDDADLWVADADGSNARSLVAGPSFQWLPHWSPDGVWIAYTDEPLGGPWVESGPAGPQGGGGQLGLGYGFGRPAPVRKYAHIWRVRADGTGSPEQLTDAAGDDRAAAYSPDGSTLVFDSARDGPTRVFAMDADGTNIRRLTFGDDDWGASWSPDGTQIAFNTLDGQIWVLSLAAGVPREVRSWALTSGPGVHRVPSWSPAGTSIAFTLETDRSASIWSVAVDGSDLRNLSNDPRAGTTLISGGEAWGKDGRIVYTRGEAPPVDVDPLVREDLAAAALLITALMLALVAIVVVRIEPPMGAYGAILGISTAAFSTTTGDWRFLPAAVVGGLIVDVMVRISTDRWKAVSAGAGSAAALVVGYAVTVALTRGLGWSPTLLGGVLAAAIALAWLLAELVGPHRAMSARTAR